MPNFESGPSASAEIQKDQEREAVVEKVRNYFEEELAQLSPNNLSYKGKEKELRDVIEAFRSNDYAPAFLYFEDAIKILEEEMENERDMIESQEIPGDLAEYEREMKEQMRPFEEKIAALQGLKESLIIKE